MNEPKDPFKVNEAEAKICFDLMQTYINAGFRRAEAFQITMIFLSIGAQQGAHQ